MEDGIPRLRPMDLGDLLDEAFMLYRRNFALFAGVVAILAIPEAVVTNLISNAGPSHPLHPGSHATVVVSYFVRLGATSGASSLAGLVFSAITTGALARAISARYLGRPITIVDAYKGIGAGRLALLVIAALLYVMIIVIGAVFFVLPAVFMYVAFLFVPQVLVLERTGIFGAFGRSQRLVSGSWWRVFGIALLLTVLVAIIAGGVAAVIGIVVGALFAAGHLSTVSLTVVERAFGAIAGILVQPIQLGALTLLYYDLRIRKEGFDIEVAAHGLEAQQLT